MTPVEQTVFSCQTFVVVVPTWLSVLLVGYAITTICLCIADLYLRRASHGGGQ